MTNRITDYLATAETADAVAATARAAALAYSAYEAAKSVADTTVAVSAAGARWADDIIEPAVRQADVKKAAYEEAHSRHLAALAAFNKGF